MEELLLRILRRDRDPRAASGASNNNNNNNNNNSGSLASFFMDEMESNKKRIPKEQWMDKMAQVTVKKSDLNRLVMNYLVIEGYKDAAERFQQESGTEPGTDLSAISERMWIRTAVQTGQIEEAIARVNKLFPKILETHPTLLFHLQQQRLIELIRKGMIKEAISFAQSELAPWGDKNAQFLEELEKTMALLAFEESTMAASPVGYLLDHSYRLKTASELNAAILTAMNQEKDPKLPYLLKMLKWSQNELDQKGIVYPKINDIATASLDYPPSSSSSGLDQDQLMKEPSELREQ